MAFKANIPAIAVKHAEREARSASCRLTNLFDAQRVIIPADFPEPSFATLYRGPRAVPHVALPGLPHLRGVRQIANRHRAPAAMRCCDPGIVPFGKLSQ